jgi:DNA-binding NtrC family response regulator
MPTSVLVIESNDLIREAVYQMVRVAGFPSIAIADPNSALRLLRSIKFKVMITGIAANDLAIAPLVNAAKALQPDLRIIVSKEYSTKTTYSAVADEYINFPFSLKELQSTIEEVVQRDGVPPT